MLAELLPHLPFAGPLDPYLLASFGVASLVLLYEGHRWRYPWRPWLLLVGGTLLLCALGSHLIADLWPVHPVFGQLSGAARGILGGLVGGGFGLALLRRILGFDRRAADAFALPFALGMGVQGLASLPLTAPPSVDGDSYWQYLTGCSTWLWHLSRELIAAALAGPTISAAQVGLCALIVAGLLLIRRRQSRLLVPGNAWLLAVALFAAGRFGLEFWRDPALQPAQTSRWLGLTLVQGSLAAAALTLASAAIWRARTWTRGVRPYAFPADRQVPNLVLLASLTALTFVPTLAGAETFVVRGLLAPVLLLEGWRLACVTGLVKPQTL